MRKIGGPDYRYYVETDGDDSDLNGRNMVEGARDAPWFDAGLWRLEIQPPPVRKKDRFLVALAPSQVGSKGPEKISYQKMEGADGVATSSALVLFAHEDIDGDTLHYQLNDDMKRLHILVGAPGWKSVRVAQGDGPYDTLKFDEGVVAFESCPESDGAVSIQIERSH